MHVRCTLHVQGQPGHGRPRYRGPNPARVPEHVEQSGTPRRRYLHLFYFLSYRYLHHHHIHHHHLIRIIVSAPYSPPQSSSTPYYHHQLHHHHLNQHHFHHHHLHHHHLHHHHYHHHPLYHHHFFHRQHPYLPYLQIRENDAGGGRADLRVLLEGALPPVHVSISVHYVISISDLIF